MISSMCLPDEQSWTFTIAVEEHWRCRWPRPNMVHQMLAASISVDSNGEVDFSELLALLPNDNAPSWAAQIPSVLGSGVTKLPAKRCFRVFAQSDFEDLNAQLLWAFARQYESIVTSVINQRTQCGVSVQFVGAQDLDSVSAIQHFACQYVISGVEQFPQGPNIGCASDKGWAHSFPLQTTQFFGDGGYAVQAIPQVAIRMCKCPTPTDGASRIATRLYPAHTKKSLK